MTNASPGMKTSMAARPAPAGQVVWAPGILNTPVGHLTGHQQAARPSWTSGHHARSEAEARHPAARPTTPTHQAAPYPWTHVRPLHTEAEVSQTVTGPMQVAPAQNKRPAPNDPQSVTQEALKRAKISHKDTEEGRQDQSDAPSPAVDHVSHTPAQAGSASSQLRPQPTPQAGAQQANPSQGSISPMVPGGDQLVWGFLDFIKRMDCRSTEDMLHLRKYVEGRESFEFSIFSSTTNNNRMDYLLKIGGILGTRLSASPLSDEQEQTKADQDEVVELRILEIELAEDRVNALQPHELEKLSPPSYLVPLGEIYVANRSSTNNWQEVTSTNFFVLMDVTTPRKAIWMVYRYGRCFGGDNGPVWKAVPPQGREKFLKGGLPRFDALCLLNNVKEWRNPAENIVTMDWFKEALPGRGNKFLQPVFSVPVLTALRGALRDGWAA